ncbi:hypothetical protein [Naasia sp. SYSU D00057]|uniref:hypothetical protein n=1 Tax=Naasia sp. SYSU D00057 TaxID=2817380 RepID=UPI001B30A2F9|nr:hypothetical protein [Naasia sp. SYSU D00057]
MIDTFLRPPAGAGEVLADVLRVLGVGSTVLAAVLFGPVQLGVFALALLGLVAPRFLGVRPAVDVATGVVLLLASWASALDLYVSVPVVDVPMHLLLNGLVAGLALLLLRRTRVVPALPRTATVVLTTALGCTAGVLWEIGEWAGNSFLDASIYVGYADTIGDLTVGGLGSLFAGLVMPWFAAESRWRGRTAESADTGAAVPVA